ncbi:hypothetical protein, partial [Paenibacillus xylanexedens]|uniref:hypothetical protein n=1 Tax=Paenibacillus xylanexedens TaxID=528191 RepID=UPI0011A3D3A5
MRVENVGKLLDSLGVEEGNIVKWINEERVGKIGFILGGGDGEEGVDLWWCDVGSRLDIRESLVDLMG